MLAVEAQVGRQPGGVALLEHGLWIHQPGDEMAALAHGELLLLVAAQQHQGDHVRAALDHHPVEALERSPHRQRVQRAPAAAAARVHLGRDPGRRLVETSGRGIPGGVKRGLGHVMGLVVDHALLRLLQHHGIADQVRQRLEHLRHPGALEHQVGEAAVSLLAALQRERLVVHDLAVEHLGDLHERHLAVEGDQREAARLGLGQQGRRDLREDGAQLDHHARHVALGQRHDEAPLRGLVLRDAHAGHQQAALRRAAARRFAAPPPSGPSAPACSAQPPRPGSRERRPRAAGSAAPRPR